MSTTEEHLAQLLSKHDLWVQRHINYEVRRERVGRAVGRAITLATSGPESSKERRATIRERLRALQALAEPFARVGDSADVQNLRKKITAITSLVDQLKWDEAEQAIQEAHDLIDVGTAKLDTVVALQWRVMQMVMTLERLRNRGCQEEFKVVELAVQDFESSITPATAQAALIEATGLEQRLEQLQQHIAEERDRIKDLQRQCEAMISTLGQYAGRAQGAKAKPALLSAIGKAQQDLKDLSGSRDESTLTRAIQRVELAAKSWLTAIVELEEALARQDRIERVGQIRADFEKLVVSSQAQRESTWPSLDEEPARIEGEMKKLLAPQDADDVDAALALYLEFEGALKSQAAQIDDLQDTQDRLRDALADLAELQEGHKPNLWEPVAEALEKVPESMRDPSAGDWDSVGEWPDFHYSGDLDTLERVLATYRGKAKRADASGALKRARKKRDTYKERHDNLRAQASDEHLNEFKDALSELAKLIDGGDKTGLEGKASDQADELLAQLKDINDEISEQHTEGRKNTAKIDKADKGHSIARHGPEVTDDQLKTRLTSGKAPDKTLSATKKSTRFRSYRDWELTRNKAFEVFLQRFPGVGANFDQGPPAAPASYVVTEPHGRVIGSGFAGTGAATEHDHPYRPGEKYKTWDTVAPLPDMTKTKTTLSWNGSRWVVAQHFPVPK